MDRQSSIYRKPVLSGISIFFGLGLLSLHASQPPARLHGSLEDGQTYRLNGNTRPMLALAQDQGEADDSTPLTSMMMRFSMTSAQQSDLEQLLEQQVTRKSSSYHKWLTPEQYASRFGVNENDLKKVTAWLEREGFSNVEVGRGRAFVTFAGTAGQARAAFQTSIHSYLRNGESRYANSGDPYLPKALEGMVAGIHGLDNFIPKPRTRSPLVRPHFTSSISGSHFLAPDDFATIYDLKALYGSGIDGTGQKIAVVGQSDITLTDLQAFRTAAGLAQNNPQIILTGTDPGARIRSGDQSESELDLEWSGAVAKNATIIFVNSTDVLNTSLPYAIDNNVAPVISITYGSCESGFGSASLTSFNSLFQQASVQGITLLAASGDSGAADCEQSGAATAVDGPAVDFPGTSPYVTSVGGTTLNEGSGTYWSAANNSNNGSALSYIPEVAWNDTAADGSLAASGGGVSTFFSKPSWQAGTGVPNDGFRDVPDVALTASPNNDPYLVCTSSTYCLNGGFRAADSTLDVVGGTSAATPSMAAVVALLNQKYGSSQGNINPVLYAVSSFSTDAFHDITSGNNIVSCRSGTTGCPASLQFGFSAGTGYDQVTGLGSIDANNLLNEWAGDFGLTLNPAALTITRGTSGTTTVNVAKEGNFNGTVSFTCTVAAALTNTTCAIPGTVTGSGTATLTITAGASAASPMWRPSFHNPKGGMPWLIALAAGLFLSALSFLLPGNRRKPGMVLAGAMFLVLTMASCGDGSSTTSTLSGSGSTTANTSGLVTVTATSGTVKSTATITVTLD